MKPQPVLSRARTIYILQGEIVEIKNEAGSKTAVIPQGTSVGRITGSDVWLVFRATTLHWTPATVEAIVARLESWKKSGNQVAGLQIDFDAKTKHLPEYALFLRQVRSRLPSEYRLSITGLLDWAGNGDTGALNGLKGVVDEVVVQTYQGRKTIGNYRAYLPSLQRLAVPFKIGLIQNGEWQPPVGLESNALFQGYVVFLQNVTASRDAPQPGEGQAPRGNARDYQRHLWHRKTTATSASSAVRPFDSGFLPAPR